MAGFLLVIQSDVEDIVHRLTGRAEMNLRTSQRHPDPLVQQLARARADAYLMAIQEVNELLRGR